MFVILWIFAWVCGLVSVILFVCVGVVWLFGFAFGFVGCACVLCFAFLVCLVGSLLLWFEFGVGVYCVFWGLRCCRLRLVLGFSMFVVDCLFWSCGLVSGLLALTLVVLLF